MKKLLAVTTLTSFILTFSVTSYAKEFNTGDITAKTLNPECIDYCVVGVCFYLMCTPVGCSINTTARIRHYLPDLFVTVYDEPEENPWTEYRETMGSVETGVNEGLIESVTGLGQSGGDLTPPNNEVNSSIKFKEVSVVGHPYAEVTRERISDYICPSEAEPFNPYYSSTFDYLAWRWGIPDRFTVPSLIPGKREIGDKTVTNPFGNTWGSIYPRQGSLLQIDDAKAAAVIAQRAVDIVTRSGQPHVYDPFENSDDGESDEDIDEEDAPTMKNQGGEKSTQGGSNENGDRWQMFSPKTESTCKPFGNKDADWSEGRTDEDRQYAWNYWRRYECCVPGVGVYIGTVKFSPICVN